MRMVDLIIKKRLGKELSNEEIKFIIENFNSGKLPDYQMSSFSMAVVFNGMTNKETSALTKAIIDSGDVINLSKIKKPTVDKHSTGGVGDKTTLVLGPMLAAMDMAVAKLSGRGLGHTGGTIDKLESIPGFNCGISNNEFIKQVNKIGLSIIGQTQSLTPADKKLYALRDVTGTVESIPLIASSIMSKKIASGAKNILLDVKVGEGAFMKTTNDAIELAKTMVGIGKNLNRNTAAFITEMSEPLGFSVGNRLEVREAIETLKGNGPKDLVELCVKCCGLLGKMSGRYETEKEALAKAKQVLADGSAYAKFLELVKAQGGDVSVFDNMEKYVHAKYNVQVKSKNDGYVKHVQALTIGDASMHLGAGRATKEESIDEFAGIVLEKKRCDAIKKGDVLFTMHSSKPISKEMENIALSAFEFTKTKPEAKPTIIKVIK